MFIKKIENLMFLQYYYTIGNARKIIFSYSSMRKHRIQVLKIKSFLAFLFEMLIFATDNQMYKHLTLILYDKQDNSSVCMANKYSP